ncbi:MAG: ferritin [Pyrinomonadaceae bacterium]|nr:ferritin [Pyrinomonadaceae bacterium]
MSETNLIGHLNSALSLELTGMIQYSQHSFLVTGTEREVYRGFFREQADEAREHALFLGDKIVALGGLPTVEPAMIRQTVELKEMLVQALRLERDAFAAYVEAWKSCGEEDLATKFWLEEQIAAEQLHIEELEKLTSQRTASVNNEQIVLKEAV